MPRKKTPPPEPAPPAAAGLVLGEGLQGMLDHFAACFNIRIACFAPSGDEACSGMRRGSCAFCRFLRSSLELELKCRRQDRAAFQAALRERRTVAYTCHAGLREAVQPVFLENGEAAGLVMIGQFRVAGESYAPALPRNRPAADRRELDRLWEEVPAVAPGVLPHMLALFSLLVETITRQRLVGVRGDLHLARLRRFIEENVQRRVTLADAARALGRSPSTVTHLVRARLGVSFKQAVIAAKLEVADHLMQAAPGTTVAEAAAAVGYNPFHFSRLYRKNRGRPPRTAKAPRGYRVEPKTPRRK